MGCATITEDRTATSAGGAEIAIRTARAATRRPYASAMRGRAVGLALRRRTRNDHGDPIRKAVPTPSAREAAWRVYVTHARRAAAVAAVMAGIAAFGGGGGSSTAATGTATTSATSTAGGATSGRAALGPAVVASDLPFPAPRC
jgi:hypothetical protein